jgi:hypothetical protein
MENKMILGMEKEDDSCFFRLPKKMGGFMGMGYVDSAKTHLPFCVSVLICKPPFTAHPPKIFLKKFYLTTYWNLNAKNSVRVLSELILLCLFSGWLQ